MKAQSLVADDLMGVRPRRTHRDGVASSSRSVKPKRSLNSFKLEHRVKRGSRHEHNFLFVFSFCLRCVDLVQYRTQYSYSVLDIDYLPVVELVQGRTAFGKRRRRALFESCSFLFVVFSWCFSVAGGSCPFVVLLLLFVGQPRHSSLPKLTTTQQ